MFQSMFLLVQGASSFDACKPMLTIGRAPQNFGLILGYRTSILPMTSLLFHIPAANRIQPEEAATTPKRQAQGMPRLLQIPSTVPILELVTVQIGLMPIMHGRQVLEPGAVTTREEHRLSRMVRPSITIST